MPEVPTDFRPQALGFACCSSVRAPESVHVPVLPSTEVAHEQLSIMRGRERRVPRRESHSKSIAIMGRGKGSELELELVLGSKIVPARWLTWKGWTWTGPNLGRLEPLFRPRERASRGRRRHKAAAKPKSKNPSIDQAINLDASTCRRRFGRLCLTLGFLVKEWAAGGG